MKCGRVEFAVLNENVEIDFDLNCHKLNSLLLPAERALKRRHPLLL